MTDTQTTVLKDALLPALDQSIRLPIFEGPLDLLLFLIKKDEIDIHDIPIEVVTKQYLGMLYSMQHMDLEVAGDFFVMASTLMYIKSRLLLPKEVAAVADAEDEDVLDPRWELVEQLLEYKRFKEAAGSLDDLIAHKQDYLPRHYTYTAEPAKRPLKPLDTLDLWTAFNNVLRRLAERMASGSIHVETITVSQRMEAVLTHLQTHPQFLFSDLVPTGSTLPFLIATFLATLELCRLKRLRLEQTELFDDIHCYALCETQTVRETGAFEP